MDSVFIFGYEWPEPKRDPISSLPLEVAWTVFSFLDDKSLHTATKVCKKWRRLIVANKILKYRLNMYDLAFVLGSDSLVKWYMRSKRRMRRLRRQNYLPCQEQIEGISVAHEAIRKKRRSIPIAKYTKRMKLF